MTTYTYQDEANPKLDSYVSTNNELVLSDGDSQTDFLTSAFSETQVTCDFRPPRGWTLTQVTWTGGSNGVFAVPTPGNENTDTFLIEVQDSAGVTLSTSGSFKVKKSSGGED